MTALIRYLVVLLLALPVMGFVREAQAATISVTSSMRSASTHPNNLNTTWISRADCLADDVISLALSVTDAPLSGTFQVWASAGANDCKSDEIRKSTSVPVCGLVFETSSLGSTTPVVRLSNRDILFALSHPGPASAQGKGTVADCAGSVQSNPLPQALTLWLMFTDVGGVANQSSIAAVQTKFALLGPNPPTGLTAGPGDTILKLNWDAAAVGTVASYAFFCDPKPGTEGDGGFVVVPLDATGTTTPTTSDAAICSDASSSTSGDDGGDDAGDGRRRREHRERCCDLYPCQCRERARSELTRGFILWLGCAGPRNDPRSHRVSGIQLRRGRRFERQHGARRGASKRP